MNSIRGHKVVLFYSINGGAEKYSVSVLIPKDDTETINAINAAVDAAIEEGIAKFAHQAERVRLVACLVSSWSFEQPCTPENVQAFLRESPQIMEATDKVAANRRAFFKGSSNSSSDTPRASSS